MPVVSAPVTNRKELERWRARSRSRWRFLLTSFITGSIAWGLLCIGIGTVSQLQENNGEWSIEVIALGVGIGLVSGVCFGGPMAWIACFLLYSEGVSNYADAMAYLRKEQRVCDLCGTAALYDDKHVMPSKRKKHTKQDLVPQMHLVVEDGNTHVRCDACLADFNTND